MYLEFEALPPVIDEVGDLPPLIPEVKKEIADIQEQLDFVAGQMEARKVRDIDFEVDKDVKDVRGVDFVQGDINIRAAAKKDLDRFREKELTEGRSPEKFEEAAKAFDSCKRRNPDG